MRISTAYFAGVGTVVAAVTVGLGSGVLISNIVSPHAPKTEMSKLELRMSEKPIPAANVSLEPAANVAPAQAKPAEAQAAVATPAARAAEPSPPQAAAPVTQAATSDQAKAPEAAFAKARDTDVKTRDADVKVRDVDARRDARRAVEEKRKAERRQQWTERRRLRPDQDLRDVEAKIRQETEPAEPAGSFASERVRLDMPRIQLFEAE